MILANENAISSNGYIIPNSLRFQAASSQYASRTFSNAATNNLKGTLSVWVKRGTLGYAVDIISCYNGSSSASTDLYFNASNQLEFDFGNTAANSLITNAVYRDPSAWYHVLISVDTTQATASNRVLMYVNGVKVTSFATANYPAQNTVLQIVSINANNRIGANWNNTGNFFDGYMSEYYFIDGQALTPSSFGTTDATSGQWVAKKYTGTYGTNGFYLPFSNGTSTTTLGADSSGNGNNWTLTNFTRSAGVSDCWMYDVPSGNSSTGGNYAVLNPLDKRTYGAFQPNGGSYAASTITNGNLTSSSSDGSSFASIWVSSGKWYCEATITTSGGGDGVGLDGINSSNTNYNYLYRNSGLKYTNGSSASYGASFTTGDVIGIALDMDAGTMTFYKNNTSQGTAFTSIAGLFRIWLYNNTTGSVINANFGQRSFAYTPPSGFKALCTANLPVATIKQGNKYMDATLYTGTGAVQNITNAGSFKPDFIWMKSRSSADYHAMFDSIRGVSARLSSNVTDAESVQNYFLTSINSNGWTAGTVNGTSNSINGSGISYVGWQWQAGQGTTSSNTNGSITSTVSVNATAGFSIVTYTGTGANATVGHGLGVAPSMMIIKQRSGGTARAWQVYHASMGNGGGMYLNQTNAYTVDATAFNNTSPTSSVFTVGSSIYPNQSGSPIVAYCFAEIAGFSKFGSYTGNGSTDGTFVYTGFRPKFVLVKCSSSAQDWLLLDTSRNPYNASVNYLYPDLSNAEGAATSTPIDILSNGFKLRNNTAGVNGSGDTVIYMAFAENPLAQSNAR